MTRQIAVLEDDESTCSLPARGERAAGDLHRLFDRDDLPEAVRETLRKAAPIIARGARPQTSPLPLTRELGMRSPFSFAAFPSWKRVFEDTRRRRRRAFTAIPRSATQFREELKRPAASATGQRITVHEVQSRS